MAECRAEIAGNVWKVLVAVGQRVEAEEEVITLESMKMEIPVLAPAAGTIAELKVQEGDQVTEGDLMVVIED
jgi:biotin carboxyl carrier protein